MPGLYDKDFVQWTARTAKDLRAGRVDKVDLSLVAEEIEDMGKERIHALGSYLRQLLAHLLKWEFQPSKRTPSWLNAIGTKRVEIEVLLEENPSLRRKLAEVGAKQYLRATRLARQQTGLEAFPAANPYSVAQLSGL